MKRTQRWWDLFPIKVLQMIYFVSLSINILAHSWIYFFLGLDPLYQPQNQSWAFNQNNVVPQGMYACPICHKLFKYKGNMKEHLKIQCGKKKPFRCHICFKDFSYKQNLKTHMGIIHKTLLWNVPLVWH